MLIKREYPPNYEQIKTVFDLAGKNPVFTYGSILYNPHDLPLPDHVIIHETVHKNQQQNPEDWWAEYLKNKDFRLSQEIEAYRAQYKFAKRFIKHRETLFKLLHLLSMDLSSAMYGNIIGYHEALAEIKK